ncbi:MAG: endonuclease III [Planctomycetaceae bacterium]
MPPKRSATPAAGKRKAPMRPAERAMRVVELLKHEFPVAECALQHESPYQLLAATILSAQCTDERVNKVTPALFKAYPTPFELAEAPQEDVEEIVRSTGFFRAKAENLRGMARRVVDEFEGEIPTNLDDLVSLPGVGRKTANVLLGTWYGIASGVVVDTHVKRITSLIGLTRSNTPEAIERDLMKLLPEEEWVGFSHRIIYHGRKTCIARRPQCEACCLISVCQRKGLPKLPGK